MVNSNYYIGHFLRYTTPKLYSMKQNEQLTKMIYLASPFSHKNPDVEERRYLQITRIAAKLIRKFGYALFCPITQSFNLKAEDDKLGTDFEAWKTIDLEMIRRADELWVVKMKGWDKSIGVLAELEYAKSINKTIKYLDPKTLKEVNS